MANKVVCRVCGKVYDACNSQPVFGEFRWKDVACSPECGAEYLRRIRESRKEPCVTTEQICAADIESVSDDSIIEESNIQEATDDNVDIEDKKPTAKRKFSQKTIEI